MILKTLMLENNAKFMENYIYEDLELIPKLVLYTKKIGFLDKCLYNYVIHENSTMRQLEYTQKLNSIYFVTDSLMKSFEEMTVEAAVTGDYGTALQALTLNPLVPSGKTAKIVLDELLEAHKKYLPQFFKK